MISLSKLLLFLLFSSGCLFAIPSVWIFNEHSVEFSQADNERQFENNVREVRTHIKNIIEDLDDSLRKVQIALSILFDENSVVGEAQMDSVMEKIVQYTFFDKDKTNFEIIFTTKQDNSVVDWTKMPGWIGVDSRLKIVESDGFVQNLSWFNIQLNGVDTLFLIGRKTINCENGELSCRVYAGVRVSGSSGILAQLKKKLNVSYIDLLIKNSVYQSTSSYSVDERRSVEQDDKIKIHDVDYSNSQSAPLGIHGVFDETKVFVSSKTGLADALTVKVTNSYKLLYAIEFVYVVFSYLVMRLVVGNSVANVVTYANDLANNRSMEVWSKRNYIVEMQELQDIFADLFKKLRIHALMSSEAEKSANIQKNLAESARAELECQNLELESMNAQMEQFVYSTSHDLKSPLTSMRGLAQAAMEDIRDGDIESLDMLLININKLCERMSDRIEDTLGLIGVDHVDFVYEEIQFESMLEEVLKSLPDPPHGAVELTTEFNHDEPLFSCRVVLFGILENLVGNAFKYSHPKRDRRTVEIFTRSDDSFHYISVRDNGVGIPEEFHGEAFKMFRKFDLQGLPGTGLGLALVKKYTEKIDGVVSFNSSSNGTTFKVQWPVAVKK